MKLMQATLHSFGKFKNFMVDFSDSLHVIYGLNEAGKTTIIHFIEGMLYGFFDPFKKGRRMVPIYSRYMPSDGIYQGALTIEFEGKTYTIERDFKNHTVKVLNAKTGKDLTDTLPFSSDLKQADIPAWINVPYPLFLNTVRITQSDMETTADAESILFKRLSNLKKTKSTQFSGDGALKYLKDIKDTIGSKSAPTKPYARALARKETLKAEKKALEEKADTLEKLDQASGEIDQELINLTPELSALREALKIHTTQEIAARIQPFYQTFQVSFKGWDFQETLEPLKPYAKTKIEVVRKLKTIHDSLKNPPVHPDGFIDLNAFEESKETLLNQLKEIERVDAARADLTRKIELTEESMKHLELPEEPSKPTLSWTAIFIVPLFIYLFKRMKYRQNMRAVVGQFAYVQKESVRLNDALKEYKNALKILDKEAESLETNPSITAKLDALNKEREDSIHYERALSDFNALKEEAKTLQSELTPVYDALEREVALDELETLLTMTEDVFQQLGRYDLKAILTYMDQPWVELDMAKLDSLEEKAARLEKKRSELNVKKAALHETLTHYETVAADLASTKAEITAYEARLKTVKKAENLIKRSIDIIEENFAPALAEAIEKHLDVLTLGRYKTVKVRKSLQFKVEDLEGLLKESSHFSTATLDQIHLAIRLGILDVLGLKDMPLLLDDAFMHFDKSRLEAMLKVLPTLNRQVILLTAHEREMTMLKALKIDFEGSDINA